MGGKEEEMEDRRRREEGLIIVSDILSTVLHFFTKHIFMSNEHNMIVTNQPMLNIKFTWRSHICFD